MTGIYHNSAKLQAVLKKHVDYRVFARQSVSDYAIFAPHGGRLTQGFRRSLFDKPDYNKTHWHPNQQFDLFTETIHLMINEASCTY